MMKAQVAPVTWAFAVGAGEGNRTPTVSLGIAAVVPRGALYGEAELPRMARGCWAWTREVARAWPKADGFRGLGTDAREVVALHDAP